MFWNVAGVGMSKSVSSRAGVMMGVTFLLGRRGGRHMRAAKLGRAEGGRRETEDLGIDLARYKKAKHVFTQKSNRQISLYCWCTISTTVHE